LVLRRIDIKYLLKTKMRSGLLEKLRDRFLATAEFTLQVLA
jgi:hypothetical protein